MPKKSPAEWSAAAQKKAAKSRIDAKKKKELNKIPPDVYSKIAERNPSPEWRELEMEKARLGQNPVGLGETINRGVAPKHFFGNLNKTLWNTVEGIPKLPGVVKRGVQEWLELNKKYKAGEEIDVRDLENYPVIGSAFLELASAGLDLTPFYNKGKLPSTSWEMFKKKLREQPAEMTAMMMPAVGAGAKALRTGGKMGDAASAALKVVENVMEYGNPENVPGMALGAVTKTVAKGLAPGRKGFNPNVDVKYGREGAGLGKPLIMTRTMKELAEEQGAGEKQTPGYGDE